MFERTYVIVRNDGSTEISIRVVARYYPGVAQSWFEPGEPEEFEIVSSVDDFNGHEITMTDAEVDQIHTLIHRSYNNPRGSTPCFDTDDGIF